MTQRLERDDVLGGRFRLVEPLAEDPLLAVWRAEDLELSRDVIVKVLAPRWMDDPEMVERFRFEALAAAQLVHENVASTFDVEHTDGALYTVSERVPGPSVAQLRDAGPLPAMGVAAVGQQAAAGLATAHAHDLVHRAICPENLVVARDGRLCIIDFGSVQPLAGGVMDLPEPVFPEPGISDYWPPERLAGREVDDRGDVYSLGLVLWELLTGAAESGSVEDPGPVRRVLASLPGVDIPAQRLREVLTRATAEDPADRPRAAELADDLVAITGIRPQERLEQILEELDVAAG